MVESGQLLQVVDGPWKGCIGSAGKRSKDYPRVWLVRLHRYGTVGVAEDWIAPITVEDAQNNTIPVEYRDAHVALVDNMIRSKTVQFERLAMQIVELEGIRVQCESGGEFTRQDQLRLGAPKDSACVGA